MSSGVDGPLLACAGSSQQYSAGPDSVVSRSPQKNGSAVPLAIQRQIFSVVVPLVLLFLCAIFWVVWCAFLRSTPHAPYSLTGATELLMDAAVCAL
jgi:hypothetical protein